MSQVVVAGSLPADHPRKEAVEHALVDELEQTLEPWMVVITLHPAHTWWSIKLTRIRDGFAQTLVLGENQQTPQAVRQSIRTVVRTAQARRYDDEPPRNPELF